MSWAFGRVETRDRWNHNIQFHDWILAQMPAPCENALDVGCGDGVLARKLGRHASHVTAVDSSQKMIALARNSNAAANIRYVECDFLSCPVPDAGFDFIAAVAVLHHMPLDPALLRLEQLLRRRGVLAVVGLARNGSVLDYACAAASIPIHRLARWRKGWWDSAAPIRDPAETYFEIGRAARSRLPGVELRRRLFFRYTMLWRKP